MKKISHTQLPIRINSVLIQYCSRGDLPNKVSKLFGKITFELRDFVKDKLRKL